LEREAEKRQLSQRQQTAANDFTRYRDRPVAFVRDVLGAEPWQRQIEIMEAVAREPQVSVRSCNGAGKTLCAAWVVLWFLYTRPGAIAVTTAPTANQVKNLLWRRMRDAFTSAKVALPGRCLTQLLEIETNWYALGIATDKEVNFQGPHSPSGVLFVGDEASGLKPWIFTAMEGGMTEPGAKMFLIGNPNAAAGYFYESQRKWEPQQRFHISAFDVPAHVLVPEWKVGMLKKHGKESPVYQVRVLGEFPPQGDDALISINWVEAAIAREMDEGEPCEMGVDIARYGGDESVAYVRRGPVVVGMTSWRGSDLMTSTGRIVALHRQHGTEAIKVDDIGMGGGVTDRLLEMGLPVVPVNVGESARDSESYANLRAELFFGLAERFKAGDISLPEEDSILLDQLTSLKFTYTSRGQLKLESKEDMRKRLGSNGDWSSPDRGDSLALCFAVAGPRWLPSTAAGEAREAWS
jgi:phage terminase large subunit